MTQPRREIHAVVLAAVLSLGGCASTPPPTGLLTAAETAIDNARQVRADDYAPVELGFAEEKLAAARQAMDEGEYDLARIRAQDAELNASLAVARSRAAIGRSAVQKQSQENARLRQELLGEGAQR